MVYERLRHHAITRHLLVVIASVLMLAASLALSWGELLRQDRLGLIAVEASTRQDESRDTELLGMPVFEYFAPDMRSRSFSFVGEATAQHRPIGLGKKHDIGTHPCVLTVRLNRASKAGIGASPMVSEFWIEVSAAEGRVMKTGDRLWVYRVVLPSICRRTGDAYGDAHERFIGSLHALEDPIRSGPTDD